MKNDNRAQTKEKKSYITKTQKEKNIDKIIHLCGADMIVYF